MIVGLCSEKETIFHIFFPEFGKREKSSQSNSLCELGKIWNYSLRPQLKNPNFESMDEL